MIKYLKENCQEELKHTDLLYVRHTNFKKLCVNRK